MRPLEQQCLTVHAVLFCAIEKNKWDVIKLRSERQKKYHKYVQRQNCPLCIHSKITIIKRNLRGENQNNRVWPASWKWIKMFLTVPHCSSLTLSRSLVFRDTAAAAAPACRRSSVGFPQTPLPLPPHASFQQKHVHLQIDTRKMPIAKGWTIQLHTPS